MVSQPSWKALSTMMSGTSNTFQVPWGCAFAYCLLPCTQNNPWVCNSLTKEDLNKIGRGRLNINETTSTMLTNKLLFNTGFMKEKETPF